LLKIRRLLTYPEFLRILTTLLRGGFIGFDLADDWLALACRIFGPPTPRLPE